MIVEYYRPKNIAETLDLLTNKKLKTVLIGGGTTIDRYASEPFAVVDLQDVGLNNIRSRGNVLEVGATVTLQALFEHPRVLDSLKKAIHQETSHNRRHVATVVGTLVASDGRSPFCTAMLALDASVELQPGEERISLGDLFALREEHTSNRLITRVDIPRNVRLVSSFVARTPADLPILFASVCVWPSGRTRVGLGGYGKAPILAMDGPSDEGAEEAAHDAYSHAGDQWASGEYRQEIAGVLVKRCLSQLSVDINSKDSSQN
jgi:CO/xanthine dehydrogenase FAD-binding subunit